MLNTAENHDVVAVAALNCLDAVAFAAYVDYEGMDAEEAVEEFQDHYAGTHDSLAAWAEEYADDTGMLAEVPESLRNYFDFASWSRDAELNGDIWTIDTECGIAIFWR
ncbi:antirestriction protein ArdA [Desulfovibrio sp.]|uniref:antirestriction protein ArdA n=1 Tax=Desulfovibrio sp. TaxID=885 RepID=UPI0025BFEA5E|nr:antirestriction protein ArdA [Desulfovibrio sp.]